MVIPPGRTRRKRGFCPDSTPLAVGGSIKRLRLWMIACKGSFFFANVPSTIDRLVASLKEPFVLLLSALERLKNQWSDVFATSGRLRLRKNAKTQASSSFPNAFISDESKAPADIEGSRVCRYSSEYLDC